MVITRTNSASLGEDNLEYNFLKVQEGVASVISSSWVRLGKNSHPRTCKEVCEDFLRHIPREMRWNTRPVTHLTLNPDPLDAVTEGELRALTLMALRELDVGGNAHVAFLHHDTGRLHAHIVFLRLRPGVALKKLPATYDLSHSLTSRLGLEPMHPALSSKTQPRLRPISLQEPELAAQMRGALLAVSKYYHPRSMTEYQAIVESFGIRCLLSEGHGTRRLHYLALDEMGMGRSMPVPVQRLGYRYSLGHVMDFLEKMKEEDLGNHLRGAGMDEGTFEMEGIECDLEGFLERLYDRGVQVLLQRDRLLLVNHQKGRAEVLDPRTSDRLLRDLTRGLGLDSRLQVGFLIRDFYLQREPLHRWRCDERRQTHKRKLTVGGI